MQELNHIEKIPYYQVAKQALIKWYNYSEKDAETFISTYAFHTIESKVGAKQSLKYAIDSIIKSVELDIIDKDRNPKIELVDYVYKGNSSTIMDSISKKHNDFVNNIIMDALFAVHDGWVRDNVNKFINRKKKHQHMPSELIGWEEVKTDLIFVRPIFELAGIKVNEEELEQVYNDRVKKFFLDRKILTTEDLINHITKGKEFYPALEGYGDIILQIISKPYYVKSHIIRDIEKYGIGNIDEIISQIIDSTEEKDLVKLSEKGKDMEINDELFTSKQEEEIYYANNQSEPGKIEKIINEFLTELYDRRKDNPKEEGLQAVMVIMSEAFAAKVTEEDGSYPHDLTSINLLRHIKGENKFYIRDAAGLFENLKDEREEISKEGVKIAIVDCFENIRFIIDSEHNKHLSDFKIQTLEILIDLLKNSKNFSNVEVGLYTPKSKIDVDKLDDEMYKKLKNALEKEKIENNISTDAIRNATQNANPVDKGTIRTIFEKILDWGRKIGR